ncbi:MAG: acyl carrier protein [Burkholderiales bacterium]|nr:acyl carrier protein [Bacteroidia bacterium]
MSIEEIIKEVNSIFIDVLDNDEIVVQHETISDEIEEWDSLNHIQLVVAIEKHFKIRFTAAEIVNFNNVGEMCVAIKIKIAS